jgi:hypothetical protein
MLNEMRPTPPVAPLLDALGKKMIRVFAVVFAFVMILTMGYVCVNPELDESDELILSVPEADQTHEVIQIGHNVTSLRLYLIASDQFPQSITQLECP